MHFAYGSIYQNLGVYEQSLEHYLLALENAKDLNYEDLIISAEGNLGVIALNIGEYEKAIATFLKKKKRLCVAQPSHNLR